MPNKALYAGSFDPLTNGHMDVVRQACDIFDQVVIAIARNSGKGPRHYPTEILRPILREILQRERLFNCGIFVVDGLPVDACREIGANYLVRGIRGASDFLAEEDMARTNKMLDPRIKTVYLRAENDALSSSAVRELLKYGQDISKYVPPEIKIMIERHERQKRS